MVVDLPTVGEWLQERKSADVQPPESRQHFDIWQFATADYRVRFAEAFPTEDELCTAVHSFESWTAVRESLKGFRRRMLCRGNVGRRCPPANAARSENGFITGCRARAPG
ncbi:hypothetical protein MSAS_22140 [Mycobacterium saskatchewanense]|nr:hypothetical protein MSAS_22140 [Mycobacterium saskatchewanense]